MPKKSNSSRSRKNDTRQYETDVLALQSLSLIAAPNPKDDLTDEQLSEYFKKHKFSTNLIEQIIETVRKL